jgi:nuclear pore complex protein Nup85
VRVASRLYNSRLRNAYSAGPEVFVEYASELAPSLPGLVARDQGPHSLYLHRMMFVIKYAQFLSQDDPEEAAGELIAILRDDIAPRSWWPVLLCDSVELLQHGLSLVSCLRFL